MEKILYGKPVAHNLNEQIRIKVDQLPLKPGLSIIKFGSDPSAVFYFNNIIRRCEKLGIQTYLEQLTMSVSTIELSEILSRINKDPHIHGIIIQKPLPPQIDEQAISNLINPSKDIDGISPINLGKVFLAQKCFTPCTAAAVIEIIKYYGIQTQGKHVVILGRSPVVAKPLAGLLLQKNELGNATVTICHTYTENLSALTQSADILVAAIGKPAFVKADMIKDGAICLDVGINSVLNSEGKSVYIGDIDFDDCLEKVKAITPVPGGIGSVTTEVLLDNLCKAAALFIGE
ncbi:MAG: bifunctional 5,10-methylenetetrahydrofolate dehydrogenase/5,10-methenyltetrahydrofolate cyclohydrolase [Candidatus Cloacimonadaceae bacterium]